MSFSTRQKGHQYCELAFPKGTIQGDGPVSLSADKDNQCTKVSPGQVRIRPSHLSLHLTTDQPPALVRYLLVALGTLFLFSPQGPLRASNQPRRNECRTCRGMQVKLHIT